MTMKNTPPSRKNPNQLFDEQFPRPKPGRTRAAPMPIRPGGKSPFAAMPGRRGTPPIPGRKRPATPRPGAAGERRAVPMPSKPKPRNVPRPGAAGERRAAPMPKKNLPAAAFKRRMGVARKRRA